MLSVYVAGLKKGTGKTLLCAGLASTMQSLSYATSYYKPIQTGTDLKNNDENFIKKFDRNIKTYTTYRFQRSSSPLIAAYTEGVKKIDTMKIMHDFKQNLMLTECHIVEGNNGISSPFDEKKTEINLIEQFCLPVILVINPNINKIDDVISGINYIHSKNVNLMGIVINDYDLNSDNIEMKYFPHLVNEFTGVRVLGCLPHYERFQNLSPQTLISDILNRLNIEDIFSLTIAKLV